MHYSMQFYILYIKLLNHLQQKVINLQDIYLFLIIS